MNKKLLIVGCSALLLLMILPFLGTVGINIKSLSAAGEDHFIFWQLRIPRTILAFMIGGLLALAGMVFQNIFRNSLATPYTLGVSSGASAGIVIALKWKLALALFGINGIFIFGFAGGLLSVLLILAISKVVRSYSIYTLLMSGVAINFFFSALILLVQYLLEYTQTISVLRWLMGGISVTGYREVLLVIPVYLFSIAAVLLSKKELLLLSAGDHFAHSKGLNVQRFRMGILMITSMVVGVVVSIAGPIGFIGLIIPHIARLICRNDFIWTTIISLLGGGLFLTVADFLARILISPVEIPVGVITSFIGAPFFIFILISHFRKN